MRSTKQQRWRLSESLITNIRVASSITESIKPGRAQNYKNISIPETVCPRLPVFSSGSASLFHTEDGMAIFIDCKKLQNSYNDYTEVTK